MSEWDKMVAGEEYDPQDPYLTEARTRARALTKQFNESAPGDVALRADIPRRLFGAAGDRLWIEPPFYCDYGANISTGDEVFFNSVIGAGSVVTRDLPSDVFPAGNPCRVVRRS